MSIAYRRLTSRRDPREYADAATSALAEARKSHLLGGNRPGDVVGVGGALIAAEITGPREVDAVDGTATVDELAAMLRARTLAPSDLVNDGTGWQTLREFIPLLDEVDARDQRDRLRTWAMWGLVLVLAVAGFMAVGAYVRSQLGE